MQLTDRINLNLSNILVAGYLLAIVTANYLVTTYGPWISVYNAFFFIGLNITTRDYLHSIWQGARLKRNMFLLIATGSILSVFFNAGWIAFASFVAFAASEGLDAIVYHQLGDYPRWFKVNGSNLPSALLDSILFPLIAFGWPLLWYISLGQFGAKVLGGAVWFVIIQGLIWSYSQVKERKLL